MTPYFDRPGHLANTSFPVLLSAEINRYGYWVVIWSVRPGLHMPVTCTKVGISRSEAVFESSTVLGLPTPAIGGTT